MKRIHKAGALLLILVLMLSLFSGCSSKSMPMDMGVSQDGYPQAMPPESPAEAPVSEEFTSSEEMFGVVISGSIEPDKVITTVYLSAETLEFDKSLEALYSIIEKAGGYLSSSNIYYGSSYSGTRYRNGEFSIRVPKNKVNQFRAQIPDVGNITSESTSKEDVTRYYRDTESRMKVLEIKEERLLGLLERAEKIEDIIALENQLSEVIYEKENLKATLINLDDRVDYSTFNLDLREVAKVTSSETVETTFMDRVRNAFDNSLYQFIRSAENFAILLIYNGPGLLVLIIILFIFFFIVRKIFRKIFPPRVKYEPPKPPTPPEEPKEETKE
ncbi:MAG: DUF4349 domain-containing protein [Gudongella sp.]|jgi:hypothetical protein|nr:DUF4349 domain-containing protein [Gudongella sp.]